MSAPRKPDGYAPDLFSEHARLAQLGQAYLDILQDQIYTNDEVGDSARWWGLRKRALALGLIPEAAKRRPSTWTCATCRETVKPYAGQWQNDQCERCSFAEIEAEQVADEYRADEGGGS